MGKSVTPAMRRSLIESDLIQAVQDGRMSNPDRYVLLWYLKAGDFTLGHNGMSANLRATALRVSPTLAMMEAAMAVPTI